MVFTGPHRIHPALTVFVDGEVDRKFTLHETIAKLDVYQLNAATGHRAAEYSLAVEREPLLSQ